MNFITIIFQLKYYHNYSLEDVNNLIPWERIVHIKLIQNEIEKEKHNQ